MFMFLWEDPVSQTKDSDYSRSWTGNIPRLFAKRSFRIPFSDKRPDEKPKAIRFPESILAILFFVFIFLTGGYSLKNYH